ncbi:MAG: helix-turn-helix transcriptional regulator, partial [Anaerolineae bacterium]|nr:helix-turn-helix transcriptional regulator [Anaerolineae bacterium]
MDLLLTTKMTIPRTQPKLVVRPHLVAQLDSGLRRRLTLVSAPAGFGKTTLVAAWADGLDVPTAWLSLDDGDNDPVRFLSYLIAAFDHANAGLS